MGKKTAIITGASSGFGLYCTLELAKQGFHVVATMRDIEKSKLLLKMAKEQNIADHITVHSLDVTSSHSINEFSPTLLNYPSIDVLINNAGFALGGFSEEVTVEEYKRQFDTNFFGVIAVTQKVLPFMRAQGHGRIINMSSISGRMGFPGLSPYVSSKHALEGYSESLSLEVKPFGIDVVLVEPGSYKTNIWASVDSLELHLDSPYRSYFSALIKKIDSGKTEHGNPQEVAKLIANLASQENSPDLRYPIGKGVKRNLFLKNVLSWKRIENVIIKNIFG
jgi:NAD(P)-dependent dehydrogenase (short-subunit alcohol dehydrogenase family)